MQAPLLVPNAADPGFAAGNQAAALGNFGTVAATSGFDTQRSEWTAGATDAQKATILDSLALKLTYTVQRAMKLFAPANGDITFMPTDMRDGQFRGHTLVLSFASTLAVKGKLHLGGREATNEPDVGNASQLYRCQLSGKAVDVSLLFTMPTPELDAALKVRLTEFVQANKLKRRESGVLDTQKENNKRRKKRIADTLENHVTPWWDGVSQVPFTLRIENDADRWLVDLKSDAQWNTVVIQAVIREGSNQGLGGHEFLCNPGFVLRALGVAGDQALRANDDTYRKISGDCVWPVATGGTIESGGTNPHGTVSLGIDDVFVVYGGSANSAVFQPPRDRLVPGCLFSYTSIDDVKLYSRKLEDRSLGIRLWQPTLDAIAMAPLRETYGELRSRGNVSYNTVFVPSPTEVILVTEYATPRDALDPDPEGTEDTEPGAEEPSEAVSDRAIDYPKKREEFLSKVAERIGYGDTRTRPRQPYVVNAITDWARTIHLNSTPEIRPEHPKWGKQRKGQIRRLFPLRLEIRDETAADRPGFCWLTQDDIDCIRQEYAFHLKWNDYWQTFDDVYGAAVIGKYVHGSPTHRITTDALGKVIPSLGTERLVRVPTRRQIRPRPDMPRQNGLVEPPTSYRHTLLMDTWQDRLVEATAAAKPHADAIQALLDSSAKRQQILANIGTTAYPDPGLPRYAAEVVAKVMDMLESPEPAGQITKRGFLCKCLRDADAFNRFEALWASPAGVQIGISSAWRPPEHNESVSTTPNSNHQLGEAMDTEPVGTNDKLRNPLAMLAHHLGAQDLWATHTKLREMLMEYYADEYTSGVIDQDLRLLVYSATALSTQNPKFWLNLSNGTTQPVAGSAAGKLGRRLLKRFQTDFKKWSGQSWPNENPNFLDMYIFALTAASHVHFTWNGSS